MKALFVAVFTGLVGFASVHPIAAADVATFNETVLYSFCGQRLCTDGRFPTSLVDVNGTLYGTTNQGGGGFGCFTSGCGMVFSFDPGTQTIKVLYSFCRHGILSDCADGANPLAGLIDVNGLMYGTTGYGGRGTGCGRFGCGTVFSFDPNTGVLKTVYSFAGGADGHHPVASLVEANGLLYGTTEYGGGGSGCFTSGCGTVFSVDPATGVEKVLYSFCPQSKCPDGWLPVAGMVAANGKLYGTTPGGGGGPGCKQTLGCGTVFSFDPNTGTETVLYAFCAQSNCEDGDGPGEGSLIDVNGILYGTTSYGGKPDCSSGCGTVFSLDPGTGAEAALLAFSGDTDGQWPLAGVISVKGKLYGATYFGGPGVGGTVFSLDTNTGREKVLYSFCSQPMCADGANPETSPVVIDSKLYGITGEGGAHCQDNGGCGTLFLLEKTR